MEDILTKAKLAPLFNSEYKINEESVQLIRQAYSLIKNPQECVYCNDDREMVFDILAEQAVLHDDLDFFRRILEKGEGTMYENDYFFSAVAQTGRSEFVEELLKADEDYHLYNFFEHKTKANALTTINSLEFISLSPIVSRCSTMTSFYSG